MAELYASMDAGYIGVDRDPIKFESLGQRLGNKLTEYNGSTHRLITAREDGQTITHDYIMRKNERDADGISYKLVRIPESQKPTLGSSFANLNAAELCARLEQTAREAKTYGADELDCE